MRHQQVARIAQRRVRRDPRIPVRAAALHPHHQMLHAGGRAHRLVRLHRHLAQHRDAPLDGPPRAAGLLDRHVAEVAILPQPLLAHQIRHLQHLAAQPHQQDAREIRVARITRQRAEQRVIAFVLARHAAARAMHDGHHAIDIGEVIQHPLPLHRLGDEARDRPRTVHARQDSQIVARPHAAVRPVKPQEAAWLHRQLQGPRLGRERIVLLMRPHAQGCAYAHAAPA